jgi:hypothetical protein
MHSFFAPGLSRIVGGHALLLGLALISHNEQTSNPSEATVRTRQQPME